MHPKAGGKSAPAAGIGVHHALDRCDQCAGMITGAYIALATLVENIGGAARIG